MSSQTTTPPLTPEAPPSTWDLELVIAHYDEDLSWLKEYSPYCSVYSKGKPPSQYESQAFRHVTRLPNIGRETQTYLSHITRNYDSIAPVTIFLQGNIHDVNHGTPEHTDLPLSEIVSHGMQTKGSCKTIGIGRHPTFSNWDGIQYKQGWVERRGKTLKRTDKTPGQFWEWMFQAPHPTTVTFVQGALFVVPTAAILRRPKSFYERVLAYFEDLNEINPEEGHFMERFWYAILSDDAVDAQERHCLGDVDQLNTAPIAERTN